MTGIQVWRPVDGDPALKQYFTALRRQKPVQQALVFLGLAVLMFLLRGGFSLLGVFSLALGAGLLSQQVRLRVRFGWWLAAAPSLLADATVTRVRAEVVDAGRSSMVLAVDGGRLHLHMTNANALTRELAARQSEISLFGPNTDGVGMVVFDGLPVPLPAKVVPAPTSPRPVTPTGMDLPRQTAVRVTRFLWVLMAGLAVMIGSLCFDVFLFLYGWSEAWLGFAMATVLVLGNAYFRGGGAYRLPKLLAKGQWQAYPVQRLQGPVGRGLRLVLTLPDGRQLPVSARVAPAWLEANVSATGTLWVAGAPAFGASAFAGLPGYPLATAVRFV